MSTTTEAPTSMPALATFLTRAAADEELTVVLRDEPEWEGDLWAEAFQLVVAGG